MGWSEVEPKTHIDHFKTLKSMKPINNPNLIFTELNIYDKQGIDKAL
jgi:hypothetical protein